MHKTVSTDSLIELVECVLKNNIFECNTSSTYKQLRGTAIGTKMNPLYAVIFMGDLKEKLFKGYDKKPLVWWQYIDDILMLWEHGEEELEKFLEFLNCYHPTTNFLGVSVRKKNNQLVTDLYTKPTNIHQYLHASSCHVYHSKKSIPYSQALRLNRISSESLFHDKRYNKLEVWLRERGYSDRLDRQQILKACKRKRKDLLNDMKDREMILK